MNTATAPQLSMPSVYLVGRGKLGLIDVGFFVLLALAAGYSSQQYGHAMDIYETVILWACVPSIVFLGWLWPSLRPYLLAARFLPLLVSQPMGVPP